MLLYAEDLMKACCPHVLPLKTEVEFGSRVWLHRLKDDVDRMSTGHRSNE